MDYAEKRKRMVEDQLIPRGISDPRVIDAFLRVKRHEFVPPGMRDSAYADHPLPIGGGQTISQPYMVALMTEALGLKGREKVLEVGTGSGYQAAILSQTAAEVYTVERDDRLCDAARTALEGQGITNVNFRVGDGSLGWPEAAPFGGIIVTAGSPSVPEPLKQQLSGGAKLVIPVGDLFRQMLKVVERDGDEFIEYDICPCVFVPLVGRLGWRKDQYS